MEKIDYKFRVTGIDEFELALAMVAPNSLVNYILDKASGKLGVGKDCAGVIDNFSVPERFLHRIKTSVHKTTKNIYKKASKKGIVVTHDFIVSCDFRRVGDVWHIDVFMGGVYADKRGG